MKRGIYLAKNHYAGGTEYKFLATKRFIANLKRAGIVLLGLGIVWGIFYITR